MLEEYVSEKLRQYRQAELERWERTYSENGMDMQGSSKIGKLRAGLGMLLSLIGVRI
ncbi:hypothetical protein [Paenibacillus harenae]|uniref:Uncharacterized protein n=1 Tax=Paenibacillus harenae TaxID=306543 RepID=A0ABT9U153_PAEHA|nr:hypothetical protein [Paenibacillus harenae]MDQ0113359.1 hypothetical protein [Paenibacillus harenae]